jgi:hypothetical protein
LRKTTIAQIHEIVETGISNLLIQGDGRYVPDEGTVKWFNDELGRCWCKFKRGRIQFVVNADYVIVVVYVKTEAV